MLKFDEKLKIKIFAFQNLNGSSFFLNFEQNVLLAQNFKPFYFPCADIPRAQVRARKFGARQWIQNKKSKFFRIYDMFISFKLAEIERFEAS